MEQGKRQKRPRRSFTDDFEAGAIRLGLDEGKPVMQGTRDLDLTAGAAEVVQRGRGSQQGQDRLTDEERVELVRLRKGSASCVWNGRFSKSRSGIDHADRLGVRRIRRGTPQEVMPKLHMLNRRRRLMTSAIRCVLGCTAIVVLCIGGNSCGASTAQKEPASQELQIVPNAPALIFDCQNANGTPPVKLVRPPNAIPGEYIVALLKTVPDVAGTANALAVKYGGQVMEIYTVVLYGFAAKLSDANAPLLAQEPSVCWVSQNSANVKPAG